MMRILVAEDNLVFQWGLRSMLTQWGYDVVVVSDGEEAWQQLQDDEGPRLAILDWLMPGMDGIEVCRRVRASNQMLPDSAAVICIHRSITRPHARPRPMAARNGYWDWTRPRSRLDVGDGATLRPSRDAV